MQGYRRPSSTPLSTRRANNSNMMFGDEAPETKASPQRGKSGLSEMDKSFGPLIIKSFTPPVSTSPRSYGRRKQASSSLGMGPDFGMSRSPPNAQQLQRPSTTGSYTTTSSRLRQKNAMLAYQQQVGTLPRETGEYGTLSEERSIDMLPSEESLLERGEDVTFIDNADVRQVEHMVDAWLEQFIEDIGPQFPGVARKREFGMRLLNVFLERNLVKEASNQPNRLVTMQDKCTGTEGLEAAAERPKEAIAAFGEDPGTSDFGTQTIVHRNLSEAKILEQGDEIKELKSRLQKASEAVKKQTGHITLKELEKVKLEKEVKDLKERIDGCWCCSNPALQTPQNRKNPPANGPATNQRPNTSMGFIRTMTPAPSGGVALQQQSQPAKKSVPVKRLESRFEQSGDLKGTPRETPRKDGAGDDAGRQTQIERTRREIKDRQFQGAGSPIFDIQLRAGQSLNKKLRTELVTLRAKVQEMAVHVEDENSKSVASLSETKEKLQCRLEKLEVGLDNKHEINDRVAKEVQKRLAAIEEAATVLMKHQEEELIRLKNRAHSETREKRKQLTSARKECEKKEEMIIQSQDDRIKKLRYQIQSKEHNMMQKQVMMEQENRAVLQELDEKCSQTEKLNKENHQLKQSITKLEERVKQEQHKHNIQQIELDDVKAKAKKETSTSHGLKDQYESLKADLKEARLTAEDYINKFNLATYQIEQLEKSKWFMDKHMKRLKRDIDELEEQHKSTTDELIQTRSQCSYLLRDNSHMKVAVNEATKSITACTQAFALMNQKVAVCETSVDDSSATLGDLGSVLDKDQIRLGKEYKALCESLGKELRETKKELLGTQSSKRKTNEAIKEVSLSHAKSQWQEDHMNYEDFGEEFKQERAQQLVARADEMKTKTLVEASNMDADANLAEILDVVRDSNDLRLNLGEECMKVSTTNHVGTAVLDTLGDFYGKLFKGVDNLLFRTEKKLKSFERKEVNLRKRVVNYAEKMKSLRVRHNQELHERNKKIKDIDKSLTHEKMKVQDQDHTICDLKEDVKAKGKQVDSLKISYDAAKHSKESLLKELTLSKIKVKRLESQIEEKNTLVHEVQMTSAEYQVQVNVNNKKFDQRLEHFKGWLGLASEKLSQSMVSIKEDFNCLQDDVLHDLMKTKAYIDYELTNDNSFLAKMKLKDWERGKK
ncbi:hypothetical protein A3770_06p44950 [Chloropicon primus]|uniref:Uncharacterized protein n=2 Tax=Chloropicon primus TaxID=1764295 RepID=A0A5B8MNK0_9CHLO|nr:hypothetical protein A3770_06p44950 [Chloropicon primus]|eukprot:QDZ21977.1 hypothetical protein A3770_06p44950 [Chloropicon primus]